MKTAETILIKKFGGYIGQTRTYITDKTLLISAMEEYANQFKQPSLPIGEEVSIEELAKEVIDKRFTGIPIVTLELSAKHTAEHLLDNFNIIRKQTQPVSSTEVEVRKFVYFIEDTHPSKQGLWFGLETYPVTSWEDGLKAWTNDPLKAYPFTTFEEADKVCKELEMDGYIVTEHEFEFITY